MKKAILLFVGALVIALLMIGPTLLRSDHRDIYKEWLLGPPKTYSGIIKIWHIYSWQTTNVNSGAEYLRNVAKKFEKKNKGVFIELAAITEQEAKARWQRGESADIYSFPLGEIPQSISSQNLPDGLIDSVGTSAVFEGKTIAVPYMMSGYVLLINTQVIQIAGQEEPHEYTEQSITELSAGCTFTKKSGKTETKYVGFVYEGGDKLAAIALGERLPKVPPNCIEAKIDSFLSGHSALAVASLGIWGKLERDSAAGKGFETTVKPAGRFTDLVQYIACNSDIEVNKREKCDAFIKMLLLPVNQAQLFKQGALPVLEQVLADKLDQPQQLDQPHESDLAEPVKSVAYMLRDPVVPMLATWSKERQVLQVMLDKAIAGDENAKRMLTALVSD